MARRPQAVIRTIAKFRLVEFAVAMEAQAISRSPDAYLSRLE
jgi:hypothetical protein